MKKVLWVKFGWSEYYRGGPVDGNFGWLNDHRGKENHGRGHEAFNFTPSMEGTYYCYVPPQRGQHSPNGKSDETGWTVVCLAKHPKHKGIHVVGWYENATLVGRSATPNPVAALAGNENWSYCITSKLAYFVPPERRDTPFSDPSVRQSKFSILSGPGVKASPNQKRVLKILERRIAALRSIAITNPDEASAPDPEIDPVDPLIVFGTTEHRKNVELAAERAVVDFYEAKGFTATRVAAFNCGYDYIFRRRNVTLHVEVKGTSATQERFFLTRNEDKRRTDRHWRLAIVTDALTQTPKVTIYDDSDLRKSFDLEPYVYLGIKISLPKD